MMVFGKLNLGLWLIWLVSLWPWVAQTDQPGHLFLQNLPLQDDRLLVVTVQLEHEVDLYGAEIQLKYDPTQLQVRDEDPRLEGVQIAPGPLLAFDNRFVAANRADRSTGLIDFVFTLLKPASPINDQGVLATVVFEVIGSGPFAVEITQAKLVSSQLTAIPVTTTGLRLEATAPGGATSAPPVGLSRWWWAGLLALTVALIPLLWLLSKRFGTTAVTGEQAIPRRISGRTGNSARTAALLTDQGQRAMEQGELAQAYDRFSQAIELDPANAAAWLGKGLVAQQETEKRICFQRVLALEPANSVAQAELQQLDAG
jgi:tetratricopeptide (TPR) repeat protein